MKLLRNATGTGAVLVSAAALRYSLWPIVLGALFLACAAMAIVACAAFSSRSTPMSRLRALVRDLRGEQRSAQNRTGESGDDVPRLARRRGVAVWGHVNDSD